MNKILLTLLFSIVLLLGNNHGCGGDDDEPAPPPERKEDPAVTAMKGALSTKTQSLLNIPYADWLERFTPTGEAGAYAGDIASKYKSLIDTEDYGIGDYQQTEQNYLDQVLGRYKEARGELFEPIQERLIAENLFESGPGFGQQREYAEETASGVADITTQWAYEGIQREFQQQSYQDALKRGDYSNMYNIALSEINREMQPTQQATQAELGVLNPAMGLFGQLQQADLQEYGQDLSAWQTMEKLKASQEGSDLGGLGMGLGALAGGLLAAPTGGMSVLMGAGLGGVAGGGLGSMFQY